MSPSEKYAKRAEWLERIGLLTFGAFVVQQVIAGASAPSLILGFVVSGIIYGGANYLLGKA